MQNITSFNDTKAGTNDTFSSATHCLSVLDDIKDAPKNVRHTLVAVFSCLGLVSLFLNVTVIWAIVKTRVWRQQSTKLIFIASVIDVASCFLCNTSVSIYISLSEQIPCHVKFAMMVCVIFLVFALFFTIGVIAFDRLMHVIFLNDYAVKFTAKRFRLTLGGALLLVLLQTYLWGSGVRSTSKGQGASRTAPINTLYYIAIIVCYLISLVKLHRISRENISNEMRSLTKMAAVYVIIYFSLYTPIVIFVNLIRKITEEFMAWHVSAFTFFSYMAPSINGISNAVAFLLKNRPCRQLLSERVTQYFDTIRSARVRPGDAQQAAEANNAWCVMKQYWFNFSYGGYEKCQVNNQ